MSHRTGWPRIWLLVLALVAATLALRTLGCSGPDPVGKRMLVLGFDGMDWNLTQRLLDDGKLPAFAELAAVGQFQRLGTAIPPQSPVAWSDFITGMDAGGHGVFDFIHRDPATMVPFLSTSASEPPARTLKLGRWQIPLGGGEVRLLRQGTPFWEMLEAEGVPTTVVRIPANYPPSGTAGRELSGMGTPDLLGGYGTFTFFTTAPERITRDVSGGGRIVAVEISDHAFHAQLTGPQNPLRVDGDSVRVEIAGYLDPVRPVAKLVIGAEEILVNEAEWTGWVPLEFELVPWLASLRGMVRIYLKQVRPELELYVSPINVDPLDAVIPISHPPEFAAELARATGRFYTQGMPEETRALTSGVLDERAFLEQAALAAEEQRRQYSYLLERFREGLLFYYFGFLDQVSHVMWHPMDPEHPAHDPDRDAAFASVIEDLYIRADSIVGETMDRLGDDVTLVVMSDHGFTSWRRAFNLNTWLRENGYLALRDSEIQGELRYLQNLDWSRTQAYALGLSGLYINVRGRERFGSVPPRRYRLVRDELERRLLRVVDPSTGRPAISTVYVRDKAFSDLGHRDQGPDLVIGYARGVRASDATAEGMVPVELFRDNTSRWSGDHIIDHAEVPGVLFVNRSLRKPVASLKDLAAALMAEFGVEGFPPLPHDGGQDGATVSRTSRRDRR